MRISDWSSDVCSSDLLEDVERVEVKESEGRNRRARGRVNLEHAVVGSVGIGDRQAVGAERARAREARGNAGARTAGAAAVAVDLFDREGTRALRSEEHTSELQSLMRISYAVFCLNKKKHNIDVLTHSTMYARINQ